MPKNEVKEKEETRLDRAKKERLYYMGRAASGASGNSTSFIVSGQSGKIWTVTIPASGSDADDDGSRTSAREHRFRCNCPDHIFRKRPCKHMLFICLRVLKLSAEMLESLNKGKSVNVDWLNQVLNNSPLSVAERYTAPERMRTRLKEIAGDYEGTAERVPERKPEADEDCPICYENLLDDTPLVHCGFGCGKALHKECFDRYKQAQSSSSSLLCVYCRTPWTAQSNVNIGTQGMLLGRRAIDLSEDMPEMFESQEERQAAKRKRKVPSKGKTKKGSSSNENTSASASATGSKGKARKRSAEPTPSSRVTRARTSAAASASASTVSSKNTDLTSSRRNARLSKGQVADTADKRDKKKADAEVAPLRRSARLLEEPIADPVVGSRTISQTNAVGKRRSTRLASSS